MKKSLFFAALFIAAFVFTSCDDETNGGSLKIEAKVVNGNDYNDFIEEIRVFTIFLFRNDYKEDEIRETEIVSCNYANGGFTLTLPKEIIESAYTFTTSSGQKHIYPGIPTRFYAYKDNNVVGEFIYKSSNNEYEGRFYYNFKNCDAVVRYLPTDMGFEIKMKKGWNVVYFTDITLEKPNANLNWYFIPN